MRAAVLPGLTRTGITDIELRESNRTIEALATICRLAGKTTKADQRLPMGRLGSDRAFFKPQQTPRSRAEHRIPTSGTGHQRTKFTSGATGWAMTPWRGSSTQWRRLVKPWKSSSSPHPRCLRSTLPPLESTRTMTPVPLRPSIRPRAKSTSRTTQTKHSKPRSTIAAAQFFRGWLGVSRGLRLVHLQDVDDTGTGWTSTRGSDSPVAWPSRAWTTSGPSTKQSWLPARAQMPGGPPWITTSTKYTIWTASKRSRRSRYARATRWPRSCSTTSSAIGAPTPNTLRRNWRWSGQAGGPRRAPPRPARRRENRHRFRAWTSGLAELRDHAICPTSRGPRRPRWSYCRQLDELIHRLGRSGRDADSYLPVLKQPSGVGGALLRACLDELQVRGELTPAAFTVDDAKDLCGRISQIHVAGVSDQVLRSELRPIYRQMPHTSSEVRRVEMPPLMTPRWQAPAQPPESPSFRVEMSSAASVSGSAAERSGLFRTCCRCSSWMLSRSAAPPSETSSVPPPGKCSGVVGDAG